MITITFKVPETVDVALKGLCRDTQRPKSFFLRRALEDFLQEKALYQKALDRLNDDTDKIISADKMDKLIT